MNIDEIEIIFFQECEEGLAGMESCFAALREGDTDPETINTIFRHVHSIKGGAGAFGLERLQTYAHHYESLLDLVRAGKIMVDDDLMDLLVGAFDLLFDHVSCARDRADAPSDQAMIDQLDARCAGRPLAGAMGAAELQSAAPETAAPAFDDFDDLMAMLGEPTSSASAPVDPTPVKFAPEEAAGGWRITYRPQADAMDHGGEPLLTLRELQVIGGTVVSCDTNALPNLDALDITTAYLNWTVTMPGDVAEEDIRSVFEFLSDDCLELFRADASIEIVASEAMPIVEAAVDDLDEREAEPATHFIASVPAQAPVPGSTPSSAPVIQLVQAVDGAKAIAKPVPAPAAQVTQPTPAQTIRVDLEKLDRLVNLVGELVITQSMLSQRLIDLQIGHAEELSNLELLIRELQESTMAIRAQPIKTVFSRMPRLIRDLEGETGKRVRLELEGEMTEVDKTVIERISEPLTHLIRNAVDHGLESPHEREACGKTSEGIIRLSAAHHSGRIVITVMDDGRGINRAKVRERAIERGIVHADAPLSDDEIDGLIFAPGFSTADTVSNISGRGVGMDVVRKNIQALGGRIMIASRPGVGSTFSLSLPLTLAVLDGMVVTVSGQTMVLPLSHVVENVRPEPSAIERFGDGYLLNVRGTYVPIVSVAAALNVGEREQDPSSGVLIVVDGDQGQLALLVDSIDDQRQVVVKSLEANFQPVEGVAGATILGNGKVALIIDADSLGGRVRRGVVSGAALVNAA